MADREASTRAARLGGTRTVSVPTRETDTVQPATASDVASPSTSHTPSSVVHEKAEAVVPRKWPYTFTPSTGAPAPSTTSIRAEGWDSVPSDRRHGTRTTESSGTSGRSVSILFSTFRDSRMLMEPAPVPSTSSTRESAPACNSARTFEGVAPSSSKRTTTKVVSAAAWLLPSNQYQPSWLG